MAEAAPGELARVRAAADPGHSYHVRKHDALKHERFAVSVTGTSTENGPSPRYDPTQRNRNVIAVHEHLQTERTSGILAYPQTARSPHPCAKPRSIRPRNAQPRSQRQHHIAHTHATLLRGRGSSAGGAHPLSLMQWDRSRPMYDPTTPESLTCMPLSSHGPSCPLHAPLAPDAHTHSPPHERGRMPSRAAGASGHIRIS